MPRKARGTTFIEPPRKCADGTFSYQLRWSDPKIRDDQGRMIRQSLTFKDHDEAEKFAELLKAANNSLPDAAATAKAIKEKVPTVADMIADHITHLTGIEEQTRHDYRRMAEYHINPILGSLPAPTVDRDRIRRWVNQIGAPDPVRVGATLTQDRKDADLSREQLAERLGWEPKKVSGYETGRLPLDEEDLAAVFAALGLPRVRRLLLTHVARGMGAKTLRNVHSLLSAAFTWAIDEHELRQANPAKNIKLPQYTPAEMTFLTPAELGMLLCQFEEPYQLMARFLAGTGVRWGELIALTVGDLHVDAEIPYVSINKAVKRRPGGHYVGSPKSTRSRRLVALPLSLVGPLRQLMGDRDESAPLFRGPRGGRVQYGNFYYDHWAPAVRAVTATHTADGTPIARDRRITKKRIRIHDLRHTHASGLIARGIDLPTVQRRLGHESIVTTVDRYGHLDPHQLQAAAKAADAMLAVAGAPVDPLPDVLAPIVDLDAERRVRAGAREQQQEPARADDDRGVPQSPATTTWTVGADLTEFPEDRARVVLGDELQRVRKRCGWTQAELAERLPFDLHVNTLRGYERGAVQLTVARFMQMCWVMGAPAGQVLEQAMRRIVAVDLEVEEVAG